MIRNLLLCFVFISILSSCRESKNNFETIVPSPDVKTHLYFTLNNGEPYYLIYFKNNILVDWSNMGFIVDTSNFSERLIIKSKETSTGKHEIEDVLSIVEAQLGQYNEIIIHLGKSSVDDIQMSVVFRVYNNAVAYKYFLNGLKDQSLVKEIIELNLYPGVFSEVYNISMPHDSMVKTLSPIHNIEYLDLPATFGSKNGYELTFSRSTSKVDSIFKLRRMVSDKSEYQIENEPVLSNSSSYETEWKIIYISNNLN